MAETALAFFLFLFPLSAGAAERPKRPPHGKGGDFLDRIPDEMQRNIDAWTRATRRRLKNRQAVRTNDFDMLFDDGFFRGSKKPFKEIEDFEKSLDDRFLEDGKAVGSVYRAWREERLGVAELEPEVARTDSHVTLTFRTPDLASGDAKVDISGSRIKVNFTRVTEKKKLGKSGAETVREKREYRKIMSVPEGADPAKYRLETGAGHIAIIFDRLPETAEASK